MFENIEAAFLEKFENVEVVNLTNEIRVKFKTELDAIWFKKNVLKSPYNIEDSPIKFVTSIEPIGDFKESDPIGYEFTFEVKDEEKLIKIIQNR